MPIDLGNGPEMHTSDEGIREGTTAETLAGLKPSFAEDGKITAGNSSQICDGASAVLSYELLAGASAEQAGAALRDLGCYEISLGDTIGQGRPETIDAMLAAVLEEVPASQLAGHYHDTAGRAIDNIDASLARGVRVFDAAVGGLGGCPYAPGAAGNVATEKVAAHLARRGFDTGLDMDVLRQAAAMAQEMRG